MSTNSLQVARSTPRILGYNALLKRFTSGQIGTKTDIGSITSTQAVILTPRRVADINIRSIKPGECFVELWKLQDGHIVASEAFGDHSVLATFEDMVDLFNRNKTN